MENIKLLVQEEGRSARNLVAFNVPVIETQCDSSLGKVLKKPPTSPRSQLDVKKEEQGKFSKRSRESSQAGSRVRSASTGRDKKSELHARYWAFLFGNLQRAVDEIYQTCESDESVTECKEVIMVLDNYAREFKNLINWFKIKWEYETTPPPQRPHSLAWEIRKSSPGKIRRKSTEPILHETMREQLPINNLGNVLKKTDSTSLNNSEKAEENDKPDKINLLSPLQKILAINEMLLPVDNVSSEKSSDLTSQTNAKSVIAPNSLKESSNLNPTEYKCPEEFSSEKSFILKNDRSETMEQIKESYLSETEMVDEICQTDPEKDVDENGPKYRSSSQQTCPEMTGFYEECTENNDQKLVKDELKIAGTVGTEKPTTQGPSDTENVCDLSKKPKTPEQEPKESKAPTKSLTAPSKGGVLSVQSSLPAKAPVRNSYSHATSVNIRATGFKQTTSRVVSLGRPAYITPINKPKTPVAQRQTLASRPVFYVAGKPTSSSSLSGAKITRSKTIAKVRSSKPSTLKQATVKTLCDSKQEAETKSKKPSEVLGTTFETDINRINSNSNTSLSSSASSSIKHQENCGSVEVLTSQKNGNEDDDGWVKVRSRSRFSPATKTGDLETTLSRSASNLKPKSDQKTVKMIHKTRFHQPSSAISLPTLAFSISDCKENIDTRKVIKSKNDTKSKLKENSKPIKKIEKNKVEDVNNKKKSRVEKIKKNCSRLLNEKNLNSKSLVEYSTIEKVVNERNKSLDEKKTKEVGKSSIVDQETNDDEENNFDEEIKKNKETEEMLQKEINELEAADIEMDIETGDEETDGETTTGTEEEPDPEKKQSGLVTEESKQDKALMPKKQHKYGEILGGMSWADHMETLDELEKLVVQDCSNKGMTKDEQMDTLERLEEFVARHPGRALELHQKLSSPSRRRTMLDTVKRFQARQAKASEKREQLKMEKAQKLRELLKKVDEVKAAKYKLIEDKRQRLEMKLKRAAENRNLHLKEIMRKAHDEEEKLKEIAFINELEAQNKRHDFMAQCQEQEGRLQGIHEERQRKQEEKAAKEAAVEERRKAIEAERQEKLEKMQERQRKRDEQADKKKQEKEKERQELAREKARDRSERLEALHAAQLEAQEELQKKIQQKQEEYARRHEENIEQIRQKALELCILKCSDDVAPKLIPYETQKLCTACNILIGSEVYLLSHLRGKKHQEAVKNQINGKELSKEEVERYNLKIIVNAPSDKIDPKIALDRERIKSFKKKCKKIRLRMISKGEEYLTKLENSGKIESPGKGKLQKCLKDIEKAIASQGKGQWSDNAITALERSMGEVCRTLNKQDPQDQLVFRCLNGFCTLNSILQLDMDVPQNMTPFLPQKCFVTASSTYLAALHDSSNCKFVILSNKIISLLDLLLKRLTMLIPDHTLAPINYHLKSLLPVDPVANVLMRVIAKILMCGGDSNFNTSEDLSQRLQDIISYAVSSGIVDKLTRYCKSVRDPIDDDLLVAQFLLSTLDLLTSLTARCKTVRQGSEDPTQLLATLQVTELVGAVSILYGMLLHQGTPPRLVDATPPVLPGHTVSVVFATIRFLKSVAELDLQMFQSILGAEGISLQFRHIASYLLWYCCRDREKVLLHEVFAVIGYFAIQHRDNQMILQSGSMPTVLQQLCSLPFPYFSNPELSALLFPTLLACCNDNEENKAILEQEISYSLLKDFMDSDGAKNDPLIRILASRTKTAKSLEESNRRI